MLEPRKPYAFGLSGPLPIANRRYGRLKICATLCTSPSADGENFGGSVKMRPGRHAHEVSACGFDSLVPCFALMDLVHIAGALVRLGCPEEKAQDMAAQLHKRAEQLAAQTGRSYEEALLHLLGLMKQGWAAKEKGGPD